MVAADWIAAGGAEIALNAGRLEEAVLRAQAAIEKARAIGGIFGEGMAQRTWGMALARLDPPQPEQADEHLAAALELFEGGGCVLEVAHTNLAWGAVRRERGDSAGAAERLELAAAGVQGRGTDEAGQGGIGDCFAGEEGGPCRSLRRAAASAKTAQARLQRGRAAVSAADRRGGPAADQHALRAAGRVLHHPHRRRVERLLGQPVDRVAVADARARNESWTSWPR